MLLADNLSDVKQHCMDCSDDDYVYSHKHVITIENVQEAIHKLKSGKSDCVDSMMSDIFITWYESFVSVYCLFVYYNAMSWNCTHRFLVIKVSTHTKKIKEEINVIQTTIGRLL